MKKIKKLCVLLIVFFLMISNIALATNETTVQTPIEPREAISEETEDSDEIEQTPIEPRDVTEDDEDYEYDEDDGVMPISLDDESMYISEDEIEIGDFFEISNNISLEKTIDGNVYIIGKNVDISSNMIYGNIFVVAESVTITSDITGSAYVVANSIAVNGGGMADAYFIANDVEFDSNAYVSRDVKIISDNLTIDGAIYGSVYASVSNIEIGDYGYIQSNLYYTGELSYSDEYQIGNAVKQEITTNTEIKESTEIQDVISSIITKAVTALFIIGIILLVSNKKTNTEIVSPASVIKNVLLGILYIIIIPVVSILCMVTIIGLPVGLIILVLYILMFVVCIPVSSISIAEVVLKDKNISNVKKWLIATLIYVIIAILQKVPVIGTVVTIILGTYGISLIMGLIFKKRKNKNTNTNITENKDEEVIK